MPIEIPERKIAPPRQGAGVRIPHRPATEQRAGYELQRLGQTLQSIGGQWGDLAVQLQKMKSTNETLVADNEYIQSFDNWYAEDLSKDQDFQNRPERFLKWHEENSKRIIGTIKSQRAQENTRNKFAKYKNTKHAKIYMESNALLAKESVAQYDIWESSKEKEWAEATPEGRADVEYDVEQKLKELDDAGLLGPGEYETRLHGFNENAQKRGFKNAVNVLRAQAIEKLQTSRDLAAAISMVRNKDVMPELEELETEPGDAANARNSLTRELQFEFAYSSMVDAEAELEERKTNLDAIADLAIKKELKSESIDTLPEGSEDRKRAEKIKLGQTKKVEKTDWTKYIDLQDKVIDFLLKTPQDDGDPIDERDLRLEIVEATRSGLSMTDNEMNTLLEFMKKKFSIDDLNTLKSGFASIKEHGSRTRKIEGYIPIPFFGKSWYPIKEPWINNKEAQNIASSRMSLINWLENRMGRKKETTGADVYNKAVELSVFSPTIEGLIESGINVGTAKTPAGPKTAEEAKEPKTQREFINRLRQIEDRDEAKKYYDKWVDKFW